MVLSSSQKNVELLLHGFTQLFGIDAFGGHCGDGRAAATLGGKQGQAHRLHACLGGSAMAGVAGKDRVQAFLLHHVQSSFQAEVEVHGRGEGVAVLRRRFPVRAQIQIELGQIGALIGLPGPCTHGHKTQARWKHVALLRA